MRALEMIHLSTRLVVRHLGLYAGCAFTIAATAVVTGAETTVAAAFGDPGRVFVDGLAREQVTKTAQLAGWLLTAMCGLAIVISGFLVFSAVKQVVSLRQRELAMLRLAGAGRWHVCVMAFLECTTLALVASAPSALLGGALASPFFEMLKTVGMFSRVGLDTSVQVLPIVMVTAVLVLTSATAGLLAARSATRGDLIGSADPLSGRMRPLQVAGRLVVAGACVCAVALIGPDSDAGLAILVPVIAVVPLLALAPFLVPVVTWPPRTAAVTSVSRCRSSSRSGCSVVSTSETRLTSIGRSGRTASCSPRRPWCPFRMRRARTGWWISSAAAHPPSRGTPPRCGPWPIPPGISN